MICLVCKEPAYSGARDLIETTPVADKNGVLWKTYKYAGEARYGCKKHPPARSKLTTRTTQEMFLQANSQVLLERSYESYIKEGHNCY